MVLGVIKNGNHEHAPGKKLVNPGSSRPERTTVSSTCTPKRPPGTGRLIRVRSGSQKLEAALKSSRLPPRQRHPRLTGGNQPT